MLVAKEDLYCTNINHLLPGSPQHNSASWYGQRNLGVEVFEFAVNWLRHVLGSFVSVL